MRTRVDRERVTIDGERKGKRKRRERERERETEWVRVRACVRVRAREEEKRGGIRVLDSAVQARGGNRFFVSVSDHVRRKNIYISARFF